MPEGLEDEFNEDLGITDEEQGFDEYQPNQSGSGETITEKPTIDNFFDTENILLSIEKTFRGYQKKNNKWVKMSDPIARDEFISLTINSLRSIVNPENIITKKSAEDVELILLEKNLEFIDVVEDESPFSPQIELYFESIVNIHDHALELFLGLVQGGHGAETLKQIYAGVANSVDGFHERNDNSSFKLAVGDKDLVNIGRR